ncbi:MAG: adenosylmethionine--8-amino-7-oxononanoate transaminase [Fibrobacterota bacterium]
MTPDEIRSFDKNHIWHPYTSTSSPQPVEIVASAEGASLYLHDGTRLIDGMSSWWSAIHGYNHPELNAAAKKQIDTVSHVMFGGFTHTPAVELSQKLIEITPDPLQWVFLADSGSVSVEVAIKMALQYWIGKKRPEKTQFITLRKAYHGDTTGAMSLCDPVTGMHTLFSGILPQQISIPAPTTPFGDPLNQKDTAVLEETFKKHHSSAAAFILEPIVQGAGGMNFYSARYLQKVRQLCTKYDVLLIADEIATGFGRTGSLFACEHGDVSPDILCLGKALTGGYVTLAATLATQDVARTVSTDNLPLMHGPTFMGNPLACSIALASISCLGSGNWKAQIAGIEKIMRKVLSPLSSHPDVRDVRFLGGIGVIEMKEPVDPVSMQKSFIEKGIWVRPFGTLIYLMPPYIITTEELTFLCSQLRSIIEE